MWDYDDEVPNGYRDADIEQAEGERLGAVCSMLAKKGICIHDGAKPVDINAQDGPYVCTSCGMEFPSSDDWWNAHQSILSEYI